MTRALRLLLIMLVVLAIVVGLVACGSRDGSPGVDPGGITDPASQEETSSSGSDPGRALVETKCSMCHSLDRVWAAEKSAEEWNTTVQRMKANGLVVTAEEEQQIIGYLAENP